MIAAPVPGAPSPLAPAGSEAQRVSEIWWLILGLAVLVVIVVLGFVVVALFRRPRGSDPGDEAAEYGNRRDHRFIILGGLVMPTVILSIAAVATITGTRDLRRPDPAELRVEVTGAQWFWRVSYPRSGITTANEIRLPVDRPVDVVLRSEDVIHSFWVPRLAGKVDLIPGQTNHLRFTPQKVGTYLGECAEFCGLQHAHMLFVVKVVPAADFEEWTTTHTTAPAVPRDGTRAAAGRRLFARSSCSGCHTVDGLSDGTLGPDLSDVGGRTSLGAGSLPNDAAHMADWITDPSDAKPGVHMPPTELSRTEIADLVAYLETLR